MLIHKYNTVSSLLMLILLLFSGNPAFSIGNQDGQILFSVLTSVLILLNLSYFTLKSGKFYWILVLVLVFIFLGQYFILGFVSVQGSIGVILKITFGYIVIRYVGKNFIGYYFNGIFLISFVSLIFYAINLQGINLPDIAGVSRGQLALRSIYIFTQNDNGSRNSGMFWEPGAFAGYILLSLLFHLGHFRNLLQERPFALSVILIALATTYSTMGYIVFFVLFLFVLFIEFKGVLRIMTIPLAVLIGFASIEFYHKSDFLGEKITQQTENALELGGDFSNTRTGALLFDWHYIKKHPFVGNGLHQTTRYADHPLLLNQDLGHGNGFSNFIASMGIILLLFYAYLIVTNNANYPWLFLLGVTGLLQGEQFMNYPIFLSLPLVFCYGKKDSCITNVSQSKR